MHATRFVVALLLCLGALSSSGCGNSSSSTCSPATCTGCCDSEGQCQFGTSAAACGVSGGQCMVCGGGLECLGGQCAAIGVGGGNQDAGSGDGGVKDGGAGDGGTGTDAGTCEPGLTACGAGCVDLQKDPQHCGSCSNACDNDELCNAGQCRPDCRLTSMCPPGLFYCDANDGQCKPGCASASQCPQPGGCDLTTHTCACAPGTHLCGASCVPNNSTASCGSSCTPCPVPANATATCDGTSCGFTCNTGFHLCNGSCVPNTSVATCGNSCTPCATDPNGVATCDGTSCGITCNPGHLKCGGACAACPTTGVSATTCSGASCVASACSTGFRLCNGQCASCPSQGVTATACSGNSCVPTSCATGYKLCQGTCATCPNDPNATATACSGNACVVSACATGFKVCATGCCPKWTVETVPSTSVTSDRSVSLAFDSTNAPVIGTLNGANVVMARKVNGTWSVTTVTPGMAVDMKLDSINKARFAIRRSNGIHYAAYSATNTLTVEAVDLSSSALYDPSLALDALGNPVIAYFDNTTNDLKVARKVTGSWIIETPDSTGDVGRAPSVGVDSAGVIHVVYFNYDNSTVKHARKTSSGWSIATVPQSSIMHQPSVVLDGTSAAHLVFGVSYTVQHSLWNAGSYSNSTVDPRGWTLGTSFGGSTPAIALAPNATPVVSYYFQNTQNNLWFGRKQGTTWQYEVVDSSSGRGSTSSIAVDGNGFIGIAYTNDVTETVMFATDK